ncbi:hypothetical protein [Azospirillum himalayense]|uniref:hypothetical protein n=1 Tax=Azospirillum himalayense TaxID=654847 RepID=UPI00366E87C2
MGQDVYAIGGGPSLRGFDFGRLRGRRVIACNAAGYSLPWADVLLFHDNSFFETNRPLIDGWPGLAVTASRAAKAASDRLLRVELVERPDFTVGQPVLKLGASSGHTAVSLAIAMGARRVVLLGYDMRKVDGVTHWHDRYTVADDPYSGVFRDGWRGFNVAALAVGVEVLNATPGSALDEFRRVNIDDILRKPTCRP